MVSGPFLALPTPPSVHRLTGLCDYVWTEGWSDRVWPFVFLFISSNEGAGCRGGIIDWLANLRTSIATIDWGKAATNIYFYKLWGKLKCHFKLDLSLRYLVVTRSDLYGTLCCCCCRSCNSWQFINTLELWSWMAVIEACLLVSQ